MPAHVTEKSPVMDEAVWLVMFHWNDVHEDALGIVTTSDDQVPTYVPLPPGAGVDGAGVELLGLVGDRTFVCC